MLPISLVLYVGAFGIEYVALGKMEVEAVRLFVNALMLFMRSQFSFVIGMVLAKENMLDCSKWLSKIRKSPILPWIFLLILIAGRAVLRNMIFAPFSAVALIVLFGNYNWGETWRKDITVFRKTFYEYVADTYAVLYDIYTDTCILFEKCVRDYVDTCDAVTGSFICGGLGV